MSRLIIGVGGTGAKVVESFIHLCGAGLGPQEDVTVAWIDQDVANGNTEQARTALREYMLAHRVLHRADGHRMPDSMTCDLLRTGLTPLGGDIESDNCLWVPHRDADATLAKIIGYNLMEDPERDLAHVLFDSGEAELGMGLNEGYRGRPHVGSAAFLVGLKGSGSWDSLRRRIEEGYEQDNRVFLCGSVFGGTGAAIFPTLARRLRDGNPRLRIAGALMLPYFTFRSPDDDETANVALSNQLLLQSRSALEYYDALLKPSERVFDDLYLLGWREPFVLPYHAAGARGQRNPPLVPELFGALAAARFFRTPAADLPSRTQYHCIARSAGDALSWRDLPRIVDKEEGVGDAYAAWLRFCALWRYSYGKALRSGGARRSREPWRRRTLGDAFFDGDGAEAARHVDAYVDTCLRYAAAMSAFSDTSSRGGHTFDLWAHEPIADVALDRPTAPPDLDSGTLARDIETLDRLVAGDNRPRVADIYWTLSRKRPEEAGLGTLVASIHDCV